MVCLPVGQEHEEMNYEKVGEETYQTLIALLRAASPHFDGAIDKQEFTSRTVGKGTRGALQAYMDQVWFNSLYSFYSGDTTRRVETETVSQGPGKLGLPLTHRSLFVSRHLPRVRPLVPRRPL